MPGEAFAQDRGPARSQSADPVTATGARSAQRAPARFLPWRRPWRARWRALSGRSLLHRPESAGQNACEPDEPCSAAPCRAIRRWLEAIFDIGTPVQPVDPLVDSGFNPALEQDLAGLHTLHFLAHVLISALQDFNQMPAE